MEGWIRVKTAPFLGGFNLPQQEGRGGLGLHRRRDAGLRGVPPFRRKHGTPHRSMLLRSPIQWRFHDGQRERAWRLHGLARTPAYVWHVY